MRMIIKAGPYIGPRGGKWADPMHTHPWKAPKSTAKKKGKVVVKKKGKPPGSQISPGRRAKLDALGVGRLPPGNIPKGDIDYRLSAKDTGWVIRWRAPNGKMINAYSEAFHERQAAKKWERVERFGKDVDALTESIISQLAQADPGTVAHADLTATAVIALTGLRPGNHSLKAVSGNSGVTTLEPGHVTVAGGAAHLEFVGKSHAVNTATVSNPVVVAAIGHYLANPVSTTHLMPAVLTSMRDLLPDGMKLKDLRTIKAIHWADEAVADFTGAPPPLSGNEKKDTKTVAAALKAMSTVVANKLNNTPAIARSSYIPPRIFGAWLKKVGAAKLAKAFLAHSALDMGGAIGDADRHGEDWPDEGGVEAEPEWYPIPSWLNEAWDELEAHPASVGHTHRALVKAVPDLISQEKRRLDGRLKWKGLDLSIEHRAGSTRHWSDPNTGETGANPMFVDYGYIRRTVDADDEHTDVFVGPFPDDSPFVFIVRQMRAPDFTKFDENKVMIGFGDRDVAAQTYLAHYNDPRFLGHIDRYNADQFVDFIKLKGRSPDRGESIPDSGWRS